MLSSEVFRSVRLCSTPRCEVALRHADPLGPERGLSFASLAGQQRLHECSGSLWRRPISEICEMR
jgi:hypothetical protein